MIQYKAAMYDIFALLVHSRCMYSVVCVVYCYSSYNW